MKHFSSTSISQAVLWLAFCFAITHAAPLEKRDANAAIAEIAAVLETVNLGLVVCYPQTRKIRGHEILTRSQDCCSGDPINPVNHRIHRTWSGSNNYCEYAELV